jgi:UDPglucose 6-dehydrogenase
MKIAVIGTGYVGLVTGACFAEMGNRVVCVDIDAAKVARMSTGEIPIYEPGLEAVVTANVADGRLGFTTDLATAIEGAVAVFIAVGTPQGEDGSADLQYVLAAAAQIGECLSTYTVIVNKSTVPVGTADKVRDVISASLARRGVDVAFDVVSNPEFLKEGSAVKDFMSPDRIIVGTDSEPARELMRELYRTFMRTNDRLMFMGVRDAELTKYAANAMLATKISFINEVANIAERVGADIENVRLGIGADQRIGHHFIYPGCGYGGSCFPKDVKALTRIAEDNGLEPVLLNAVEQRNHRQKQVLFEKLSRFFDGELAGREIAIWGLAFKPGTDDLREASSLVLIRLLMEAGATVRAHDPVAMAAAERELAEWRDAGRLRFVADQYDALDGADALVLVTEWKQYRQPDFDRVKQLLRTPVILDGRNQYSAQRLRGSGLLYSGIGR